MRVLSAVLLDVVALGELVAGRPLAMVSRDRTDRFDALRQELTHHDALPAEFMRATRGGVVLLDAIRGHWAAMDQHDESRAAMWLMLIGTVIPLVRSEAAVAMDNERQARAG